MNELTILADLDEIYRDSATDGTIKPESVLAAKRFITQFFNQNIYKKGEVNADVHLYAEVNCFGDTVLTFRQRKKGIVTIMFEPNNQIKVVSYFPLTNEKIRMDYRANGGIPQYLFDLINRVCEK